MKEQNEKKKKRRRLKKPFRITLYCLLICIILGGTISLINKAKLFRTTTFSKDNTQNADTNLNSTQMASSETTTETTTTEPIPEINTITLTAAGDCTLGNDVAMECEGCFHDMYDKKGADYFLSNCKDLFSSDDLTIVNLEGTFTDRGERFPNKTWCFRSDPSYVSILTNGSVEAVSFANNHCRDYGDISYTDTLDTLKDSGIYYSSEDITCVTEINNIKVGMISIQCAYRSGDAGYSKEYPDTNYLKKISKEYIDQVKADGAQLIIMNYHWGIEKDYEPSEQQKEVGHYAIDEGANLIIGHHPHRIQPVEKYKDAYIVYSLGNFCFGGNGHPSDMDTYCWRQTFTFTDGVLTSSEDAAIVPFCISSVSYTNDFRPTPSEGDEKVRIINKMNDLSKQFHITYDPENGQVKTRSDS